MKKTLSIVSLSLALLGCKPEHLPEPEVMEVPLAISRCEGVFVLAPSSFGIFFVDDGPVLLSSEGRPSDLPVFCSREEAKSRLEVLVSKKELLPNLLTIYRLEGIWEEDVLEVSPGHWRMRRPAELKNV